MQGDGQLRAFIERILRLKEEQDTLAADIREVYAEAKGSGFDKTAMGQLVAHLRKVEKVGVAAVEEGQTVFDMYLSAYQRAIGTVVATHAHDAASYAEATGRDAGSSNGRIAEFDSADAGSNPAPVASHALVAQRIEQEVPILSVAGSIPVERPSITDDDVPAFIKRDRKPLRPNCLNPDLCAGSGRDHCHACKKAMAEVEAA